jgi:hypothetical protein
MPSTGWITSAVLVLCLASSSTKTTLVQAQGCQLCSNAPNGNAPSTFLSDKPVSLPAPYSFINTCGQVASVALTLLEETSEECAGLQAVQTYCGCPRPASACFLCGDDTLAVRNTSRLVDFALALVDPTCDYVEAFLHSQPRDSDTCAQGQAYAPECDCGAVVAANTTELTDETPGLDDPTTTCTLCGDGSPLAFPTKDISGFLEGFLIEFVGDSASVSCEFLDLYLQSQEIGSQTCLDAQFFLAGICGCPPRDPDDRCTFCSHAIDLNGTVYTIQDFGFAAAPCGDLVLFTTSLQEDDDREDDDGWCSYTRQMRPYCGCTDGTYDYLGTGSSTNLTKKKLLVWVPRVTALLSLLGSLFIIRDVLRHHSRKTSLYHQLILGVSVFDAIGSVAWIFSSLPIPEFNQYGEPTFIQGAKGNDGTCTTQGFLIQFGYTSILYNVTLSFYYLLTIRYGWREARIRPYAKWFHTPVLVGLGLACTGIPFYENSFFVCHVVPPPMEANAWVIPLLVIAPISSGVVLATINMLLVYSKVRAQDKTANRWRFSAQASGPSSQLSSGSSASLSNKRVSNQLERAVFWQSLFYLGAFYVTQPILMVAYLDANKGEYSFAYWLVIVTLIPVQGM